MKKEHIKQILLTLLLVVSVACILRGIKDNNQSSYVTPGKLMITGEYSYDGISWYPLEEDNDLSTKSGKVIIRGKVNTHIYEGLRISYLRNHIGVRVSLNQQLIYMDVRAELTAYGMELTPAMCGSEWSGFRTPEITDKDTIEIELFTLHDFGCSTAFNDFVKSLCIGPNDDSVFENALSKYNDPYNMLGNTLLFVGVLLFGGAIAISLVERKSAVALFRMAMLLLSSGCYIKCDVISLFKSNKLVVVDTYGGIISMMLAFVFFTLIVKDDFKGVTAIIANISVFAGIVVDTVLVALALAKKVFLYDTLKYWVYSSAVIITVLIICGILNLRGRKLRDINVSIMHIIFLIVILVDMTGSFSELYIKNRLTKLAFLLLCLVYLVKSVIRLVKYYKRSLQLKKLEGELTDMKIAIMLSQIKPHFIYNTLGTIEQLCYDDADKAAQLVHDFALYLRGNFTELDNKNPIYVSKELEHVKHYVDIEKVRFPDIEVRYDIAVDEFMIPALSIQPLVENAIKHGLMGLEKGGVVEVITSQTDESYQVTVRDNGVGFDQSETQDQQTHIGIRNIRQRVESMCQGTLSIESQSGQGTTAVISIPKEVRDDSHSSR